MMESQRSTYVSVKMSHRSLRNQMKRSDYKDKYSQQAKDMGRMSNRKKGNDKSKEKRKDKSES